MGRQLNLLLQIGNSSIQNDGNSCGVYTCFTAHRIVKNESLVYTAVQATAYRQKMAQNLALNY